MPASDLERSTHEKSYSKLGTPEKANRRLDLNAANELRVGGSHARLYSD
jgi:hypothetical protein